MSKQPTQRRRVREVARGWFHRRSEIPPKVEPPRPRRSVRDVITEQFGKDAYDKATSSSSLMAHALTAKPIYQGTVAKAVVQRRRAANKRARAARRVHRQRAGR